MPKPKPRAAAFLACLAAAVGAPFACDGADQCAGPEGLCVAPPNASAGANATDASATSETGTAVMGGDSAGALGTPSTGAAGAGTGLDGSSGAPSIVFPGDGFGVDAGLVRTTICSGGEVLADPPTQCPLGAGDVACEFDADCTTDSAQACPAPGEVTGSGGCTTAIYGVNKASTSACGAPSCPACSSSLVLTQDCRISSKGETQIAVACVAGQCKSFSSPIDTHPTDAGPVDASSPVDSGAPVCALLAVALPGGPPPTPTKAGGVCPSTAVACDDDTDCTTLIFYEEPCGCAHAIVGVNQSAGPGCVLPACSPGSGCGPADTFQSQDCFVTSEPAEIAVHCVGHQCLTYVSKATPTPPPAWTTCISPTLFTDTCPADAGTGDPDFCGGAAPTDAAPDSASSDLGDSSGGGGHSGDTDAGAPPTPFLIDDFEDGDAVSQFVLGGRGAWYTAADSSTDLIFPSSSSSLCFVSSLIIPTDPTGGRALNAYGTGLGFGQAGISLRTGAPSCNEAMDASAMSGVRFRARATPGSTTGTALMRVSIGTSATNPVADSGTCVGTCYDAFGSYVTLTEQWSEYFVPFANIKQQGWGTPAAFDPSKLLGIIWDPQADLVGTQASCFDFWLDDVAFYQAQ